MASSLGYNSPVDMECIVEGAETMRFFSTRFPMRMGRITWGYFFDISWNLLVQGMRMK
jgi:hypothetical protein